MSILGLGSASLARLWRDIDTYQKELQKYGVPIVSGSINGTGQWQAEGPVIRPHFGYMLQTAMQGMTPRPARHALCDKRAKAMGMAEIYRHHLTATTGVACDCHTT